ncbi:hypothetical protein BEP19_10065 [Ammoniphilus oxalaticus]|uniref:Uncharacterized protein n=1 Tax=Ammoniphilus oxalaticus TaxID=66863 RepID=A0A419SFN9_9BACL|nr:hypothetical protein [Ammoniphilus oxalaticus]RKD22596.1 hypothetical protein BEP19_10065 [Ammoniphilus oxalaticus]
MNRNWLSTIMVFCCLILSIPIETSAMDRTKRVILVLANHLSLEDIRQIEGLPDANWLNKGTIGAMNLRTAGKINGVNNAITIGSGVRAIGPNNAVESYMTSDELHATSAKDWYRQLTGHEVTQEGIVVPGIQSILESNRSSGYTMSAGLLGETLRQHGLQAAAYGNSDVGEKKIRFAPLIAMDQRGLLNGGDISLNTNREAPDRVYGVVTDYDYLLKKIEEDKQSSLLTVELGDLYRLSSAKEMMDAQQFQTTKLMALTELNRFMKTLVEQQTESQMILLLAPMVSPDAEQSRSMMAPFVQMNPNQEQGILSSSTTRQPNIVTNVDIAPTILSWLELPVPQQMMGRPITTIAGQADFWKDWTSIKHIYATRSDVLTGYVTFQIVILILATAFWYFSKPNHVFYRTGNALIRFLLLLITLSPFLFLILPLFPFLFSVRWTVLFLLTLGMGLAAAVIRLSFPWIFLIVSVVNWLPILIDGLLFDSMLMKRSYLGYDSVIGARFYGIGNEYMGVVIGSSILSLAMLLELTKWREKWVKQISVFVFGLYLLFFALPRWGTNAGGAITAMTAYSASFFRLFDVRLNRRYFFWGVCAVVISIGVMFMANVVGDDQTQSHIGRAMTKLMQGDLLEIKNIIQRKLEMNWKLIGVSAWSKVFITSILLLGFICYRPFGMIHIFAQQRPYVIRGFFGIAIGAVTALLVNDSGIVAAATTIIYMIAPMLFLGLQEGFKPHDDRLTND